MQLPYRKKIDDKEMKYQITFFYYLYLNKVSNSN